MGTAFSFNTEGVEVQQGFEPLPVGWYNAMVDETEIKPTKAGDGAYLRARYTILDGPAVNRKVFQNYNIRNPSEIAEKIGKGQLAAALLAMGIPAIQQSTDEMHGKPLKIKLKIVTDDSGQYEPQNEIVNYKNQNENVPLVTSLGTGPAKAQAAPAGFGAPTQPKTAQAPATPPTAPKGFGSQVPAPAPVAEASPAPVAEQAAPADGGIKAPWNTAK